ncbi:MAG: RraA family protein [Thermodesulfobacteriota bacterium]
MDARERLLSAGTAVIADVFDNLGLTPLVLDTSLFPLPGPPRSFAGPAYTVAGESYRWTDGSGDRRKLAAIDDMPPGVAAVWAGGDIRGACCFGDLLAEAMKARGVAGVVVDGGVRDTGYLEDLGLPILARYRTPAQAIGRWRVTGVQVPVRVRGALEDFVTVSPEDLVVADEDGVVVVPRDLVVDFAEKASAWADKDSRAREDIRRGGKLLAALEKYGHL